VALPELTTLAGERVRLSETQTDKLLCVFFTPSCPGCVKDIELWQDLKQEAAKQQVAFFVIDVGSDTDALKKFSDTYGLNDLGIFVDPNRMIGRNFQVNFVPQYLLFDRDGTVLRRWDGIRHYQRNSSTSSDQLRQFFVD
jgi:peroxiredoxin